MSAIVGLGCVVVDSAEPPVLARWWQGLLGGEVVVDADGDAQLRVPGQPRLDFLGVSDERVVKNRLHLDLSTSDLDAAVTQALAHGATPAPDVCPPQASFVVLRDPEGNEFCLLSPAASPAASPVHPGRGS